MRVTASYSNEGLEILYLLTLHGVLYNRVSMTGNKGLT